MAKEGEIPELCPECERKKKEEEASRPEGKEGKKDELTEREARRKAEQCGFFKHHTMYDDDGEPDLLIGKRVCSLRVTARCGHEVRKYGFCIAWMDGKPCRDWREGDK